ncbi:uncharacterized protein [Ptychodera flava]|uniref:uncharacterized protein n=1 Tax=Ptychodera flava TaxID=63121 RepID=UPI00396A5838
MTTRSGQRYNPMAEEQVHDLPEVPVVEDDMPELQLEEVPDDYPAESSQQNADQEWQRKVDLQLESTLSVLEKLRQLNEEVKDETGTNGIGPGKFSGRENENAHRWWRRYKDFADFKKWNQERQVRGVSLYLTGEAERWFQNQPKEGDTRQDLKVFEKKFIERFGKTGPLWLHDQMLHNHRQQVGQTVEQYAISLKELGEKASRNEKELLSFFINGLLPPIKTFVVSRSPQDYTSATTMQRRQKWFPELHLITTRLWRQVIEL